MPDQSSTSTPQSVFRVDKFAVPPASMPAFTQALHHIQQILGKQPGCRQNLMLTNEAEPGEFKVVTLVEWASADDMAAAKAAVQKQYAEEGFSPPEFMRQLGVKADMGVYRQA
jgi:heme-degrading monooxygenase HmoA